MRRASYAEIRRAADLSVERAPADLPGRVPGGAPAGAVGVRSSIQPVPSSTPVRVSARAARRVVKSERRLRNGDLRGRQRERQRDSRVEVTAILPPADPALLLRQAIGPITIIEVPILDLTFTRRLLAHGDQRTPWQG